MAKSFSIVSVCPITERHMFFATMSEANIARFFGVCLLIQPTEDTIILKDNGVYIITRTN